MSRDRLSQTDRNRIKSIVASLTPETLALLHNESTTVNVFGYARVPLGDPTPFCTEEGLLSQVDKFQGPCGLVYHFTNEKTVTKIAIALEAVK